MNTILALDLGKFKTVACWYDVASGAARFHKAPSNRTELREVIGRDQVDVVVFEACTMSGWIYELCQELQLKTQVAATNGEAWKWKNVKRKTDRDDALKLARLAALGQIAEVRIPAKAVREKRGLLGFRQALLTRRVAVQNRLRAILLGQGLGAPNGARAWTQLGLDGIAQFAKPLADCGPEDLWRGEIDLALIELKHTLALVAQVDKKLDALNKDDKAVQLLLTTPGVGPRTAETVSAYLDEASRFHNGRQVSGYAGLVPRRHQSGEMDHNGRIHKRGPRLLRKMLVECAWVMLRYNGWAVRIVERLSKGQKTRKKKAVVALARKLLVRLWAMLRDGTAWRDDTPLSPPPTTIAPDLTVAVDPAV
jgi:transposase